MSFNGKNLEHSATRFPLKN